MNNILMNTDMTKAILNGRKTQTRRDIKVDTVMYNNPEILEPDSCVKFNFGAGGCQNYCSPPLFINSKYQKGDIVWVREPAKIESYFFVDGKLSMSFNYLADGGMDFESSIEIPERFVDTDFDNNEDGDRDRPIPKWIRKCKGITNGCIKEMARIFLRITDVRVERLHDISDEDCLKEGIAVEEKSRAWFRDYLKKYNVDNYDVNNQRESFESLWDYSAPTGYKWEDNPYVFVYEFKRVNKDGSEL